MPLRTSVSQVFIFFLCCFSAMATSADTTPPELIDFDITPRQVDVTNGPAEVMITVRVKEQNAMGNYNQDLVSPAGYSSNFDKDVFVCQTCSGTPKWERIEGTDEHEVSVTFEIDEDSPAGDWSAKFEHLRDAAGNYMEALEANDLIAMGFDPYVEVKNPREIETNPPELVGYSLSTTALDTTAGEQTISVTMMARDERGMGNHNVYLRRPGDTYLYDDAIFVCTTCSGDRYPKWQETDTPGLYQLQVEFELPYSAESGIWRIETSSIRDELGTGTGNLTHSELAELGFNARFVVNDIVGTSLALGAEQSLHYIEFGSTGDIALTLTSKEGQTLPPEFQIKLTADDGVNINEAFKLQSVSHAMSCVGYTSYYRCDVAVAEGLTKVDILSRVTPQTESTYQIAYEVVSQEDLNWVDNHQTVSINAHPQSYLITTEIIGTGGEFSPKELDAPIDQPANFELTTFEGYELVQVSGCGGSLSATTYTTAPVDSACTVTAEFERLSYTVDFYGNDGALLDSQTVFYGDDAVAPEVPTITGYHFTGWDADFSNVTEDIIATAQYAINQYQVRFIDHDDTVLAEQLINHGSAATAPDLKAREGYTFTGWDEAFGSVTSDLTVTAQYSINQYQVSLWVTGKGRVSPGEQMLNWGETALFELLPEAGYKLYSVVGCGGELVDELTYQTDSITEDCEVVVKFRDATPQKSGLLMLIMATQ
jgi:hypothetical protein